MHSHDSITKGEGPIIFYVESVDVSAAVHDPSVLSFKIKYY